MVSQKPKRKLEKIAERFYTQLRWYELILYPLIIWGATFHFFDKIWGGSILLLAGLILSLVYLMTGFYSMAGIKLRMMAIGLSFGLLGSIFNLLQMQSDLLFLIVGFFGLLSSLVIHWRTPKEEQSLQDLLRIIVILLVVLSLGIRML